MKLHVKATPVPGGGFVLSFELSAKQVGALQGELGAVAEGSRRTSVRSALAQDQKLFRHEHTSRIIKELTTRGKPMKHTPAQLQEWVLGRPIASDQKSLRVTFDRSRKEALEEIAKEKGGTWSSPGAKRGRYVSYTFQKTKEKREER